MDRPTIRKIVDTTLRDGAQRPGIALAMADKLALARDLDTLGISRIEGGVPAAGVSEQRTMEALAGCLKQAKLIAWNRVAEGDVRKSLNCGADIIHICLPASPAHLEKKLSQDLREIQDRLSACVQMVRRAKKRVSLGMEDASRSSPAFMASILQMALDQRVDTLRYADTVGILSPGHSRDAIKAIITHLHPPSGTAKIPQIEVHMHNDLDMAVGNTLAALSAGATLADCTLFGVGERAGNCPLGHLLKAGSHAFNFGIDVQCLEAVQARWANILSPQI